MASRISQKSHTHLSGSRRAMSALYPLLVMSSHRMPEASELARNRLKPRRSNPEARKALSCASLLRLGYSIRSPSPSTGSDRIALDVGAADGMPRWGRFPVLGLLDQVTYSPPAHLVMRERHGGEGRPQVGGNELLVVEADDRDIFGDADAPLLECLVGSHGHRVVATEDGPRGVRDPHQLCGATAPAVRCTVTVTEQGTVECQTMRIERLFVPLQTTDCGRDAGAEVYEAHPPVPLTQEDLCGSAAARHLVKDHRGPGAVLRIAIEQNSRHLAGVGGRLHGPVVHGGMDNALHPALKHHLDGGFLDLPVLAGVDYQQDLTGLPGRILRALDDVPGERRRGDLVGYDA